MLRKFCAALFCVVLTLAHFSLPVIAAGEETVLQSADLSSTEQTIAADHHEDLSATIQTGSASKVITSGSLLTAAEHIALHQVLAGGTQSLVLGDNGSAVGGSFQLPTTALSTLVIPMGVEAIHDFANGALNVSGNLSNAGVLQAITSSAGVNVAQINVGSLINQATGSIVSVGGLSLNINAATIIDNAGIIQSSGALSMVAGESITSSGLLQAQGSLQMAASSVVNNAIMQSLTSNINLCTNTLTNTGTIEAVRGLIDVRNLSESTLTINGSGKIFAGERILAEALANVAGTKATLSVLGGSFSAPELEFISEDGFAEIYSHELDGKIGLRAGIAGVGVESGDLILSRVVLTGDPIFYAPGTLDLSGLFAGPTFSTAGEDFVALAGGDIIAPGAPLGATIDASDAGAPGGQITIAAGVDFTVIGGPSPIPCANCAPLFAINGPSASGGSVALAGVSLITNARPISIQANEGLASSGDLQVSLVNSSGSGAPCCSAADGAPGQNGGQITINASGAIQSGALLSFGGGGSGGGGGTVEPDLDQIFGGLGGAGGAGGSIVVISASGAIDIQGVVNSSGGGGGGGGAVVVPGFNNAGAGGAAGAVSIAAFSDISILGPVLAAPGGNGGPGGEVVGAGSGLGFGGGGGGGSFGGGGGGGGGSFATGGGSVAGSGGGGGGGFYAGGGGAGFLGQGGGAGGFFGPGEGGHGVVLGPGDGFNGTPGTGGAGGSTVLGQVGGLGGEFGMPGQGGQIPLLSGTSGQSGHDINGLAGAVSSVDIMGRTLQVTETIATGLGFTTPFADHSINAAQGSIDIDTTFSHVDMLTYSSNANYFDSLRDFQALISLVPFTVSGGPIPAGNGAIGTLFAGTTLTINSSGNLAPSVAAGAFGGPGSITIIENGGNLVVAHNDMITPAEWIATIQTDLGAQTLILNDPSGNATGGTFTYTAANIPAGNFLDLNLPAGVTATSTVPVLTFNGSATINGALNFTGDATLNVTGATNLGGAGSLTAGGAGTDLTLNTASLTVAAGGLVNSSGDLIINTAGATIDGDLLAGLNGLVRLESAAQLTLDGTGGLTAADGAIELIAGPGSLLDVIGSLTYDAADVVFLSDSPAGSISFAAGATQTIDSSGTVTISSPALVLGADTLIFGSGASVINVDSGSGNDPLTIIAPQGSQATIATTGGAINIQPTAGKDLIFRNSGGALAPLAIVNLNGGPATTTTSDADTTVNPNVCVFSDNVLTMNVNNGTLTNNGCIGCSGPGSSVTIQSNGDLTISGTGSFAATGGGASSINIRAAPNSILSISGSLAYDAGAGGLVNFTADGAAGSVSFAAGTTQTIDSGSTVSISTPNLNLGADAVINATGASTINIDSGAGANPLVISMVGGSAATIATANGAINIAPAAGQDLTFANSGGPLAADTTLFLSGGPVTMTTDGADTTVQPNVSIVTDSDLTMNVNNGTLTNDGVIATTAADGMITVQSTGDLTVAGSGTLGATGGGASAINITTGLDSALNVVGSFGYDAGPGGSVNLTADGAAGSVNFAAGTTQTIDSGSTVSISTPNLNLGADAVINATGASTINIDSGAGANPLVISMVGGSAATIATANGAINIAPAAGQDLTFANSGGPLAADTTLFLSGGPVTMTTDGADTTVQPNVSVITDNDLTMNVNNGMLTNDGVIATTAVEGMITVQSTGVLTVAGTGDFAATGGGASAINITAGFDSALNVAGSFGYDAGPDGSVNFTADGAAGSVSFAANSAQTIDSGSTVSISTPNLNLGADSAIIATGASTINIDSGAGANPLVISMDAGSAATIATTGGAINIAPAAGQDLTFANSGGPLAADTTLFLSGGPVTMTTDGADTTVQPNVSIVTDRDLTMNVNNGTLTNDGVIATTAADGMTAVQSTGDLTVAGSGDFAATGGGDSSISLRGGSDSTLTLDGALSYDSGSDGEVVFTAGGTQGQVFFSAGSTQTIDSGSDVLVTAPIIQFGDSSILQATGSSPITLSSPLGPLTVIAPAGGQATVSTNGAITIMALPGSPIDFINSDGAQGLMATLNFNGASATIVSIGAPITIASNVRLLPSSILVEQIPFAAINSTSFTSVTTANTSTVSTAAAAPESSAQPRVATDTLNVGIPVANSNSGFMCTRTLMENSSQEDGWIVLNSATESMVDGHGLVLTGTKGTVFRHSQPDSIELAEGRLLLSTGKGAITVEVSGSKINIAAHSLVMVEQSNNITNVWNLSDQPVALGTDSGAQDYQVGQYQKLSLNQGDAVAANTSDFDVQKLICEDKFLADASSCFLELKRNSNKKTAGLPFRPVAHAQSAGSVLAAEMLSATSCKIWHDRSAYATTSGDNLQLNDGELLVMAERNMSVQSGKHRLRIKKGSVVLLNRQWIGDREVLSVTNLYDNSFFGGVRVDLGKRYAVVRPGEELIVGDKQEVKQALHFSDVPRRRIRMTELSAGETAVSSEISVATYIPTKKVLFDVYRNRSSGHARSLIRKIEKIAVALMLTTSGHGAFTLQSDEGASKLRRASL